MQPVCDASTVGAKRHFALICESAAGASALIRSLRAAGVAACDELLHDEFNVRCEHAAMVGVQPRGDEDDGAGYLQGFFAAGGEGRGFSLLYEQARSGPASTAWDFLLGHPEQVRIIHLVQRDLLAAWVRGEAARLGNALPVSGSRGAPPPFVVDAVQLERYFDGVTARRAWVRRAFQGHAFLEVRDDEVDGERLGPDIARVLRHIECKSPCGPCAMTRQPALQVERQIVNIDELRAYFRNTPHEEYFLPPEPAVHHGRAHSGYCTKPFEFFGIDAAGKFRVCCEDWLPTPIGDVQSGSLREQWNSPLAMAIRESIIDGSYRFCNAAQCPELVKGTLPGLEALSKEARLLIDAGRTALQTAPRTLSLGYDPTCNLKCPTCRSDFISLRGPAYDRAAATQEAVIAELLPSAHVAIITGHGDAISSRLHRQFLRNLDAAQFPKLKLILMTNGLTLGPSMWESFRGAHPAIAGASISIDAARPATYAVNRGGSFDKLLRNLAFLGGLYRQGEIDFLEISFVVQANCFREMEDFVHLGRRVGCSSVLFMKLIHWPGTFSEAEFKARAVHDPAHPLHEEFVAMLQAPIFGSPDVDLSNLACLRRVAVGPDAALRHER